MATYVYKCSNESCSNEFETTQSMKDDPLTHCEKCGKDTLQRVIQAGAGGFRIGGRGVHKPTSNNWW